MPIWEQLKEAIQRTKDEGGTVGHWFEHIQVRDFLIFLLILFLGGMSIKSCVNNQLNPCEHQYNYEYYNYSSNYSCVFVLCEECNQKITIEGKMELPFNENYEPTCTHDGKYTELWTYEGVPGATRRVSYIIPKLGHIQGEVVDPGDPADCHNSGISETRKCLRCNEIFGGEFVDILGHDSYIEGYIEPTCTEVGYTGYEKCHRCDEIIQDNTIIPMLEHNGVEGTFEATYNVGSYTGIACQDCGYPILINELHSEPLINQFFDYELIDSEDGIIITNVKQTEEEMVIPDHINGIPVLFIVENLFKDDNTLKTIELSKNLLKISDYAFNNCTSLEHIVVPDSVKSIGMEAFYGCSNLLTVDLGQGVSEVEAYAFWECKNLLSFKFPKDYNLDEYYLHFKYVIPVIRAPKTWIFDDYHGHPVSQLPDFTFKKSYDNSYDYVYEEDGAYYYNDGKHKVLLYCDSRHVKDNILFVPDGTNILAEDLYLRIRNLEGVVLPRSVYQIMHQRWDKDNWQYVRPYSSYNYLNYYYYGTPEEFDFIDNNGIEAYQVDAYTRAFAYYYDYEDVVYNYWDEYRWKLDSNGLPIITRDVME